jgi:hypothetical protein
MVLAIAEELTGDGITRFFLINLQNRNQNGFCTSQWTTQVEGSESEL